MTSQPSGSILIEGLRVFAYHGVEPQETLVGNTFEVSVFLNFPCDAAMDSDDIEVSINYADVSRIVRREIEKTSKLLENVVGRIYRTLTATYPQITGGRIELYKLHPPISMELGRVGFIYTW